MKLEAVRLELDPDAVPQVLQRVAIQRAGNVEALVIWSAVNGDKARAFIDANRFKHGAPLTKEKAVGERLAEKHQIRRRRQRTRLLAWPRQRSIN